jgi:hypothetical protein
MHLHSEAKAKKAAVSTNLLVLIGDAKLVKLKLGIMELSAYYGPNILQ